jgi:PadR family transcriptional regulator, regulatory protein PadR
LTEASPWGILFHRPSMGITKSSDSDFLPGTLEMLILQSLARGANHGYGIAQHIQQVSKDTLRIGEGSLYPALQRLLLNDYVAAEWGLSENNRRARYYTITAAGRKHLVREKRSFDALLVGIARVMETP